MERKALLVFLEKSALPVGVMTTMGHLYNGYMRHISVPSPSSFNNKSVFNQVC
ncbi:Hypothetical predicted protein [Scomber scombrus]|uniref:Uncharacterized protein n=1 Tax=Scomber scombrus TaxID=13677 RepID=A0AAV1MYB4_SCOSC